MPQKTVLVTGCSEGGIGAALAAEFQLRGLRVFATARDPSKMANLTSLGIETLALDVTSEPSIEQAVAVVREKLNHSHSSSGLEEGTETRLDFLVNNAGVNHIMPFSDSKISDLRSVMDTNVIGSLAVTQAFLPLLIRSAGKMSAGGKSTVVMMGSINEVFSPPYQAAYNASKAAVHAAARTLRVELAPLGVNCVTLMTGSVRSKLFKNAPSKIPDNSLYSAVADKIESRDFLKNAQWIDTNEFARQAVDDLLRPKPKLDIWRGGLATVASWLACLGWEGMLVSNPSTI
jgi:NAD(P)-dependent dehydrogenase (short-subunit alcohol dehydrogenase family)